jgi:CheY-like chemotaxis protein
MEILIVEDKDTNLTQYKQIISEINASGYGQVNPTIKKGLGDALDEIEKKHFDGAIIDLRLSAAEEGTGNEIIRKIVDFKRLPVFVYSSYLGDIDPNIQNSSFFQKFDRTTIRFDEVVKKLIDIYKTGITEILGRGGDMEKHLADIFWKHIANSFEELKQGGISKNRLLRYIVGHLYEYLELDEAGTFDPYTPEEVYIKPPIKPLCTGSIIKDKNSGELFVVLTPPCDIVQSKAKKILIAKLSSLSEDPVKQIKNNSEKIIAAGLNESDRSEQERKKLYAEKDLKNLFGNNYSHRYYFLPKSKNFEGGLINFHMLESVDRNEVAEKFEIIATINTQFLKDIIAKFAFYYSRQGAPDISCSVKDLP